MGRPVKEGLEYFPFDIDFFDDPKILFIENKFGEKGELVVVKLLTWIYRNGYYCEWSDEICLLFTKKNFSNFKPTFIQEIVSELLKRGFFNDSVFKRFGILTSKGIQKRWLNAITRSKRTASVNSKFRVVSSEETPLNREETIVNSEETPLKTEESTQSKVKESKVKEIILSECVQNKEKQIKNHAKAPPTKKNLKISENEIQTLWLRTFSRNPKMPEIEETERLIEKFGGKKVYQIFKKATLSGFKNLQTLINALDHNGEIKPKEFDYGVNKSKNGNKRGATPEELARIATDYHLEIEAERNKPL